MLHCAQCHVTRQFLVCVQASSLIVFLLPGNGNPLLVSREGAGLCTKGVVKGSGRGTSKFPMLQWKPSSQISSYTPGMCVCMTKC